MQEVKPREEKVNIQVHKVNKTWTKLELKSLILR